jgi:hypothetical protein
MTEPTPGPSVSRQGGWWLVGVSVLGIGVGLYRVMEEPDAAPNLPVATAVAPERPSVAVPPVPGGQTVNVPRPTAGAPITTAEATAAASASVSPPASQAPATKAVLDTPAASSLLTVREVDAAVERWRADWASRDPVAYLAHYAANFPERDAFARRKTSLLKRASIIEVQVEDVRTRIEDGRAITRFTQFYRSDSYRSKNLKELVWVQEDGRLRILSEASLR